MNSYSDDRSPIYVYACYDLNLIIIVLIILDTA